MRRIGFNALIVGLLVGYSALPGWCDVSTFAELCKLAAEKAGKDYTPAPDRLGEYWKNLTYDQHRDIRFRMDKGLWWEEKLPFSVDFFHPGWTAKKTVNIFERNGGASRPLISRADCSTTENKRFRTAFLPPPAMQAGELDII